MRKTAAVISWVIFTILAFVSIIATQFHNWVGPRPYGSFMDYYTSFMLPGVFFLLGMSFSLPLTRAQVASGCKAAVALYLPVVLYAIPEGVTFVAILVLVPGLIVFMGMD